MRLVLVLALPLTLISLAPNLALGQTQPSTSAQPPPAATAPEDQPSPGQPAPATAAPVTSPDQAAPSKLPEPPATSTLTQAGGAATQPALAPGVPAGQWVYTTQYGWVWMPYALNYTYVPDAGDPYMYVYYPAYGWEWVVAPWLFGWGPRPYWGVWGVHHFAWYGHVWGRAAYGWHRDADRSWHSGRSYGGGARFGHVGRAYGGGAHFGHAGHWGGGRGRR